MILLFKTTYTATLTW